MQSLPTTNRIHTLRLSTPYAAAVYLVSHDNYAFPNFNVSQAKKYLLHKPNHHRGLEYTAARVDEEAWAIKHNTLSYDRNTEQYKYGKINLKAASLNVSNFIIVYVCFESAEARDSFIVDNGFGVERSHRLMMVRLDERKIDRDNTRDIGQGMYVYDCSYDDVIAVWPACPYYTIPTYIEPTVQARITKTPVNLEVSHPKVKLGLLPSKDCTHPLPTYATALSSGFDLHACLVGTVTLRAGETLLIPSGLKVAIPVGYELQIRSRSGLTFKNGVVVANQPASIDADYSGPLGLLMRNQSLVDFVIGPGMKLAQGIMTPIVQANFEVLDEAQHASVFVGVDRKGGFGSTGV